MNGRCFMILERFGEKTLNIFCIAFGVTLIGSIVI